LSVSFPSSERSEPPAGPIVALDGISVGRRAIAVTIGVAGGVVDGGVEDVDAAGGHLHLERRVVGNREGRKEILAVRLRPAERPEGTGRRRQRRACLVPERQRPARPFSTSREAHVRPEDPVLPKAGDQRSLVGGGQEGEERHRFLLSAEGARPDTLRIDVASPAEDRDRGVGREPQGPGRTHRKAQQRVEDVDDVPDLPRGNGERPRQGSRVVVLAVVKRDRHRCVRRTRVEEAPVRPEERVVAPVRARHAVDEDVLDPPRQGLEREERAVARDVVHDDGVPGRVPAAHLDLGPRDGRGPSEAPDAELLESRRIQRVLLPPKGPAVGIEHGHGGLAAAGVGEEDGDVRPVAGVRVGALAHPEAVSALSRQDEAVRIVDGQRDAVGAARGRVVGPCPEDQLLIRPDRQGPRAREAPEPLQDVAPDRRRAGRKGQDLRCQASGRHEADDQECVFRARVRDGDVRNEARVVESRGVDDPGDRVEGESSVRDLCHAGRREEQRERECEVLHGFLSSAGLNLLSATSPLERRCENRERSGSRPAGE
jgi:hypothetical protein